MSERLERGPDGKPIYWHADDCPSYCDYACNGCEGDLVTDLVIEAERRQAEAAKAIRALAASLSKLIGAAAAVHAAGPAVTIQYMESLAAEIDNAKNTEGDHAAAIQRARDQEGT